MNMPFKKTKVTTLSSHLTRQYGRKGSARRNVFDLRAQAFLIGELIREERKRSKLTQEQLAERIGAQKSFISRIENGQCDIQLSTLYRLLEVGMGKRVEWVVR